MLPDLKSIAQTIVWSHQNKGEHDGAGIFISLPRQIAQQFPIEGKDGEDSSPSHITVVYLDKISKIVEKKLIHVVNEVCEQTKPFLVKLKKPRKFINDKGQIILHSPVKSGRLFRFHDNLRTALRDAGLPVNNKFPEYKPHVSIAYINSKKELKQYKHIKPEGDWIVDQCWLWGLESGPKLVILGR